MKFDLLSSRMFSILAERRISLSVFTPVSEKMFSAAAFLVGMNHSPAWLLAYVSLDLDFSSYLKLVLYFLPEISKVLFGFKTQLFVLESSMKYITCNAKHQLP